jgi:lysophospholipase L1-like esterase
MNRDGNDSYTSLMGAAVWRWLPLATLAALTSGNPAIASSADVTAEGKQWIGTWAAAPQPFVPGALKTFRNQSVRLILHTSAGGRKVRVKISNIYGDKPLSLGGAHLARRTAGADIDPASDRTLMFSGRGSAIVPAQSMVVSDPVDLDVPPLSDLAVSLFLPGTAEATTIHVMAKQTSYVSGETGDHTADVKFPVAKTIRSWPFLTGVDVEASPRGATIVAFGSSLTDGDGSTTDTNRRFPDLLAVRLQKGAGGKADVGVLNEGIIGNRLLSDSPRQQPGFPFGAALGQAGLTRFERDVLDQAAVRYVIVGLGINDILFPGSFTPLSEAVSADRVISGYRQLIARAHEKGIRVIGTTNPAFENAFFEDPPLAFFTPEKESVREKVNSWILDSGEFDGVVDLDKVLRDPSRPTQLLPSYDSGDHLHPNDAGYAVAAEAVPLGLFEGLAVASAPQAQPSQQAPPTIATAVDRQISTIEKQVVEAAEAMPEDRFNFSPESLNIPGSDYKGVRTFALQVKHIAASNYFLWSVLTGDTIPEDFKGGNGPEALKTKAEILKFLKDSFALGHRAAATLTAENMLQAVSNGTSSRLTRATFAVSHAFDHYGQMVEYLRMNGIVPPASRGQAR